MKKRWTQMLSALLTVVMLMGVLPAPAYASIGQLIENGAVQNAALLETLHEIYGDDAEAYLAVLQQYGLVDEKGNLVTDEKIVMDGDEYTLEAITAILKDPDTDLSKVVTVDGTSLTLEELKQIVEIEQELARIQALYFTPQDLTDEHIENFYSLAQAFASGGIQPMAADDGSSTGVDHSAKLEVKNAPGTATKGTYTFTVEATSTASESYPVTFSWRAVSGSVTVSGGAENVILDSGTAMDLTVNVTGVDGMAEQKGVFFIQIYNVKNALIGGKTRWEKQVTVAKNDTFKYNYTEEKILSYDPLAQNPVMYSDGLSNGNSDVRNKSGLEKRADVTLTAPTNLSPGSYERKMTISGSKFTRPNYTLSSGQTIWRYLFNQAYTPWEEAQWNESGAPKDWQTYVKNVRDDGFDYKFVLNGQALKQEHLTGFLYEGHPYVDISQDLNSPGITQKIDENITSFKVELQTSIDHCYGPTGTQVWFAPGFHIPVKLSINETTTSANATLTAPSGTFYPGQTIPIKAKFSFPVDLSTVPSIKINGKQATRVESGKADVCTFLYTVPEDDTDNTALFLQTADMTCTGANDVETFPVTFTNEINKQIGNTALAMDEERAFASYKISAALNDENKPVLTVTVGLNSNEKYVNWLNTELVNGITSLKVVTSRTGSTEHTFIRDGNNLVATIYLPYNTTGQEQIVYVDFLLKGVPLIGKNRSAAVPAAIPVANADMMPTLIVTPAGGKPTEYELGQTVPLIYAQQDNTLELDFTLNEGKQYTWGLTDKVTYYKEDGTLAPLPGNAEPHFAWRSSAPAVAQLQVNQGDSKAAIIPTGKEGEVTFSLVAFNGGEDKDGKDNGMADVTIDVITVDFAVGSDPFFMIPQAGQTVAIREEQDAVINWSSNICQKNQAGEGKEFAETTFTIEVYPGSEAAGDAAHTVTLTTENSPGKEVISSVTIPWDGVLEKIYNHEENYRTATVVVSTTYLDQVYEAEATIQMTSLPAQVKLEEPEGGLYQTDGGGKELTLTWSMPHLDISDEGGGKFELYIASAALTDGPVVVDDLKQVTELEGNRYSYTLKIPEVNLEGNDPGRFQNSYNITVKAKNAAEAIWASDQYIMHVYSDKALKLLLDGVATEKGQTYKMSNVEMIQGLWKEDPTGQLIVDLQRNIALKNVISANYGEYAWADLEDMLDWSSSDSTVATVNYQQGTLYENIENLPTTIYRPATDFILSGLNSGTTEVSATHVKTNIKRTLNVEVETLRDQLYLFQCYPKGEGIETVLTYKVYTDENHTATKQETLVTNENGKAAIYAEHGIAGDVYCKSVLKSGDEDGQDVTYLGTFYNRNLVSSEADSTKLQLYPVNTLQLRRAAQAVIYLKNPDGTPYANQFVTFRGGVYRDGEYCMAGGTETSNVLFGLQDAERDAAFGGWKPGGEPQMVKTGEGGSLVVTMDVTQFTYKGNTDPVEAGDRLYYLFQLDYGNGEQTSHYPIFLRMDATMNAKDVAATGDSIVSWEENTGGAKPFIVSQTLKYSANAGASVADVRKSTGKVGPSTTFPDAWLTTTVMWWNDDEAQGRANTVTLQDTNGKVPSGQTSTVKKYPFTDQVLTENVIKLDNQTMALWGIGQGESRSLRATFSADGTSTSAMVPLSFQVINMIGVEEVADAPVLEETGQEIKDGLNAEIGDGTVDDPIMLDAMKVIFGVSKYDSSKDGVVVRLSATSDPTVYRALFSLSVGNMGSDGNVTGVYPDYTKNDEMFFANQNNPIKPGDLDYSPNPLELARMINETYDKEVAADYNKAKGGEKVRNWSGDVGGYYEADIVYNSETKSWEYRPVSGGFHLGFGVNYNWFFNSIVGIVPVTISLTLGATVELSMDMQRGNYWSIPGGADKITENSNFMYRWNWDEIKAEAKRLNATEAYGKDYLTQFRIFLYARIFAGIGFDLSVVAFKIGVFGQLNVDFTFGWLNRSYLDDPDRLSAVGAPRTRRDEVMNGQRLAFSGSTGVEFLFKLLFASYEHVFCSWGFQVQFQDSGMNDWDKIQEIWAANETINNEPVTRMRMPGGQELYAINLGPQLESRDYVDLAPQEWVGDRHTATPFALLSPEKNDVQITGLQNNAYPYANPVLSDDGEIMFYLSDRGEKGSGYEDAEDITNTRVAWSAKDSSEKFSQGTRFDEGADGDHPGYGDSNVKLTGKAGNYAAAWVRQMENIVPDDMLDENGELVQGSLTEGQLMLQMNSAEIMAAIFEDGRWTLTRLTTNGTPDLAPVVATNGERTVVAWREVGFSDIKDITNFDQQDTIRYVVYENGVWSEVQTLYDGTGSAAAVKGIEAAMLADGTAAVAYTLDTGDKADNTDWETMVALIPGPQEAQTLSDGEEPAKSEDTVRTFRLTKDSSLDENPQITTVTFGTGATAVERFVIAWHTEQALQAPDATGELVATGETQSDIRLAAMDKGGVLYENMPESLGRATEGTGETVGSNFRLAKNADSINDLSILWVDSVSGGADETDYSNGSSADAFAAAYQSNVGHDVLKAVRFVEDGSFYTVSGTMEVAEMESGTLIDHFDAYVDGEESIRSIILGTNYPGPDDSSRFTERTVTISNGEEASTATIRVPIPMTDMYTAVETFTNRVELPAAMLEYDKLYPNSDIDVQFTIRNSGKAPVTNLEILPVNENGDPIEGEDAYYSTENDPLYGKGEGKKKLNLMPNRDLTVTAKIPTGTAIENTRYAILATFTENGKTEKVELPGTLNLDIPDVGISKVETVKEANGERVLRYSLYNGLSAKLADAEDGWRVRVGFYADQDGTKPLKGMVGTKDGEKVDLEMTISDPEALALIDAGGYSNQVTLSVLDFDIMKGEEEDPEGSTEKDKETNYQEIPTTGIPIYIKAWVEAPVEKPQQRSPLLRLLSGQEDKEYGHVSDPLPINNNTSLDLDNLRQRQNEDVTITHTLDNSGDFTQATVNVKYNKMTGTASGNLIVTLFDKNGNPIARQQLYDGDGTSLLRLSEEGEASHTFMFDQKGDYVEVKFTELVLDIATAELAEVALTGAEVTYDPEAEPLTYFATGTNLTSGILGLFPKDPKAEITVDGEPYNLEKPKSIPLPYGETTWEIVVKSTVDQGDGTSEEAEQTYRLILNNTSVVSGGGGSVKYPVETPKDTDHGAVTVKPEKASRGDTVTITAKPNEGYQVGKVTVTQSNGQTVSVTKKDDGTYTFTMPNGKVTVDVTFVPQGQWTNPFADVAEGVWYYDAVRYVNEKGLMAGTSANTFSPDVTTTRGMIVTILYRLAGSPDMEDEIWGYPYQDVDANAWYATAVYWARKNGIVAGYGNGTFGPNDPITREQFAAMLWRYAGSPPATNKELHFNDVDEVSGFAIDAMCWAVEQGIISGTSTTTLTSKGQATRAQAATMLMRFCQRE